MRRDDDFSGIFRLTKLASKRCFFIKLKCFAPHRGLLQCNNVSWTPILGIQVLLESKMTMMTVRLEKFYNIMIQ